MTFIINEKLDYQDFMELYFPKVLQPFYKKRLVTLNMFFALSFIIASIYMFFQSTKNGVEITGIHYAYAVFAVVFSALSYYIFKREKKVYMNIVKDINNLHTEYEFSENNIRIRNVNKEYSYKHTDIQKIEVFTKWYIFFFKNDEKIAIYKPNLAENHSQFTKMFSQFIK